MIVESPAPELDVLARVPVTHHLVPRPWGDQHVVTAGSPEAPPLLLVHGWPQHWLAWRHVIAELSTEAFVIAPDLQGLGWSEPVRHRERDRPIDAMVSDLLAVLDHFEVRRAALAGHDWGGWIGFRAVLDHPDRFTALAALAIMPPWLSARSMIRHLAGWSYMIPMAAVGGQVARRPRLVAAMVRFSTSANAWDHHDGRTALASYTARVRRPSAAVTTRKLYRSFVFRDLWRSLGPRPPRLEVPATVIVGQHETISVPDHWIRRTHPGEIELEVLAGTRHWIPDEAPSATVSSIRRACLARQRTGDVGGAGEDRRS